MSISTVNGSAKRNGKNEMEQLMTLDEIRFDRIYIGVLALEKGTEIYGYVRDWKNGRVGYSVLDYASDHPDLSDCSIFWMAPEDFAKVFTVYRDMVVKKSDSGTDAERNTDQVSIIEYRRLVKKAVMDVVPDDMKSSLTLDDTDVVKIDDQKLCGIVFQTGSCAAPAFYLNESYENYLHGKPLDMIVKQLVDSFLFSAQEVSPEMKKGFTDDYGSGFDDIRDKLVIKVLEKSRNHEFLSTVPHKDLDYGFAMVFDMQTLINGNDVWRTPVTEDVLKKTGLDVDDLYDIAMENINETDPAVLMSLDRKQSGGKVRNLLENDRHVRGKQGMYVLTNRCGRFGAAALFYPGIQKRVAEKLEDNYYAIPSSLHEFIIVPESSGADIAALCGKLIEDNSITAHQEDVFSNKVFRYDRKQSQFFCIADMVGEDGILC